MPTFRVTGPDGAVYRVEAPEGATEQDAIAYIQSGGRAPAAGAARAPAPEESTLDLVTRKAEGVKRGVRDLVDGGAQLLGRGMEAIAPAGSSFESWAKREREIAERNNAEGEAEYSRRFGKNAEGGWDGARLTGNALTAAAAFPVRVAQGAGMLARSLAAGRSAGAAGAAMPVEDTENFWPEKLKQTGTAAAVGTVLNPVAEVGIGAAGKLANKVVETGRALAGKFSGESAEIAAERMLLQAAGPDWANIGAQVQAELRRDVAAALEDTGAVNPAALRRLIDFRAQGVEPRRSWITRDPAQYTQEENLAGIKGAGEPLQAQRAALDKSLVGTVDAQRPPGTVGTEFELGERGVAGIRQVEDAAKAKVDGLYQMLRDTAPDAKGNGVRFVDRVSRALDDDWVGSQLPADFIRRFPQMQSGEFPLTPSVLQQMRTAANRQNADGRNPAIRVFVKAIDDEMSAMADELGGPMGVTRDLAQAARATAKQRFEMHEAIPAMKAVAQGEIPAERFFSTYVVNGTVKEVTNMWAALRDPAAKDAIRGQLAEHLRTAATGAARDEGANFGQATFNKMITSKGMPEKLRIILGDRALADLQRVGRVAEAAKSMPAGQKVNTSNSSQGVYNLASSLLNKASPVPVVGPMLADPLRQFTRGREVARAMDPAAAIAARANRFSVDPELARRLAALLAAPAGAASAD